MLDINLIKENPEKIAELLARKGWKADFSEVLAKYQERKNIMQKVENIKAESNKLSASVPQVKKAGGDIQAIFTKVKELNASIAEDEKTLKALEADINAYMSALPNIPDEDLLPGGKENNKVIHTFHAKPVFDFNL